MLKNKYKYQESSRQTRVKMHKSGKNWVRTVISNIGLLRFFKGAAAQEINLQNVEDDIQKHSHAVGLLRGIAATGAMLGGSLVLADHVMAEEVTEVTEQPLAMTDTVAMDTVTVTETVKDTEDSISLSNSASASESLSESLAHSQSASESQAALASETPTTSILQPRAVVSAAEAGTFEPIPVALAAEESNSVAATGKDVTAELKNVKINIYPETRNKTTGEVLVDQGDSLRFSLSFEADDIQKGNTFTMQLSQNIDTYGIAKDILEVDPIVIDNRVIATGIYNPDTKTVLYTFTETLGKTTAHLDSPVFINDIIVKNDSSQENIFITIGDKVASYQTKVSYSVPLRMESSAGTLNEKSRVIYFGEKGTTYITQINPDQAPLRSIYSDAKFTSTIFNENGSLVDFTTSKIKIYEVLKTDKVNSSGQENYLDTSKFVDVTAKYNTSITNNLVSINWGNILDKAYVIVVDSPNRSISLTTTLVYENNYSGPYEIKYSASHITQNGFGDGTVEDRRLESNSQSLSASESASESLSNSESASTSIRESQSLSESVSTSQSESSSASESLSTSESASTSQSESSSLSESLSSSESASTSQSESSSLSESLSTLESASTSQSESSSLSESLSSSESVSSSESESSSLSESLSTSESASSSQSESSSLSESMSSSESASSSQSESSSLSESMSSSESASSSQSESSSLSESLSALESASTSQSESSSLSESLSTSESVSTSQSESSSLSESLSTSESVSTSQSESSSLSESLSVSESTSISSSDSSSLSESASISESLSASTSESISMSESLSISESTSTSTSESTSLSESQSLSESTSMPSSTSDSTSQEPMHSETANKAALPHTGDHTSLASLLGIGALLVIKVLRSHLFINYL